MTIRIEKATLRHIYDAMLKPGGEVVPRSGVAALRQIAETGWAFTHQVEDFVTMADRRLSGFGYTVKPDQIAAALGAPEQQFCYRPRARSTSVTVHTGWTSFDAARMLILLEDLGFSVDPSTLVAAILPTIPKSGLVPIGALDALWYANRRGKSKVTLHCDEEQPRPMEYRDHLLPRGYKLSALVDDQGDPLTLEVRGPKYRRPRAQVTVTCEECGIQWTRGDPDSSAYHRREHRERMAYLDPVPHPSVLVEVEAGTWSEEVTFQSPRWQHAELYSRALAFKREEGYDFVQWSDPERDQEAKGFLFADDTGRLIGGCAFRLRRYDDHEPRWGLQFIWIAPPYRRRGVLAGRWSYFRERFGDFHIEGPVSPSMQAFAGKVGDERLMFWTEDAYAKFLAERGAT